MPERLRLSRAKGYRKPEGAVVVARPTIWGNPFVHPDRAQAVAAFRSLATSGGMFSIEPGGLQFAKRFHPDTLHWAYPDFVRQHIHQLRGRDLACWCGEGPCHADVLLEIANA